MYAIALFIHFVAIAMLFGSLAVSSVAFYRLRRARTNAEVRDWLGIALGVEKTHPAGTTVLVLSGAYMTHTLGRWDAAWVVLSLVAVVAMALLGALVTGRRVAAVKPLLDAAKGEELSKELAAKLPDAVPSTLMRTSTVLSAAIIALMTFKPDWRDAILIVAASIALGVAASRPEWAKPS